MFYRTIGLGLITQGTAGAYAARRHLCLNVWLWNCSGSMRGGRETVAKALALECMRGAHRQQRKCYLYAFSGPGEVRTKRTNDSFLLSAALFPWLQGFGLGAWVVPVPVTAWRVWRGRGG